MAEGEVMGYSVAIQVDEKELRVKALDFMMKRFRQWKELAPECVNSHNIRGPCLGGELAYEGSPLRIGFDYSSGLGDVERHYLWCVIHWMALTFGSKRRFSGFAARKPYYIYDGDERTAILVGDDWKNRPESMKNEKEVQPDGWHPWMYSDVKGLTGVVLRMCQKRAWGIRLDKAEKIIRAELARLTEEWQKENGNGQAALHHRDPDVCVGE
jgi:hypothetical protein